VPTSTVSVVIPAYNEADRLGSVLEELSEDYEVIVVDDASTDATAQVAREAGVTVIEHAENRGYIDSLTDGFETADGDIVITMDADGEHKPGDVPRLVDPIRNGSADVVFGAREVIPRPSERILNRLAGLKVAISDTGTGFRALQTELAHQLTLDTACTCGTFALEARARGATLAEVPTPTATIEKPRSIAWEHVGQFGHVLRWLWKV
jgi:glycosyltransferase involved in cell wall biosynthesis